MNVRKGLLFLHLVGGLISAVFLILLGASGGMLVFENELDHWLNSRLAWVTPQGSPLSLNELEKQVEQRHPGAKVSSFALPNDERLAVNIYMRPAGKAKPLSLAVNPYTGAELGSLETANTFTRKLHQFHTNLLLGPPGKLVTASSACILLGLSVTGLILWWPRKLLKLSRPKSWRVANFELHNVIGFYSSVFMFLFAVTGIVIHWDDEFRTFINNRVNAEDAPIPKMAKSPASATRRSPDELLAAALKAVPGARVTSIQGLGGANPIRIIMKYPEDGTPAGRTNLYADPGTGEFLSIQTSRTAPLGTRIVKLWNREIHTGDIGGWPTRILACLASFSLPILAITGPLIWFRRIRNKKTVQNLEM